MPRYRKPSRPASGEESGAALDAPSVSPNPVAGFGPNGPGERNPLTRKGPGGFRSSQENPVPATHVAPQFTPEQKV
jgi:hypothetical protein